LLYTLAPETLDIKYVTNSRSNGLRSLGSCSASLSIFSCHFSSSSAFVAHSSRVCHKEEKPLSR
jgi:hypothetical protein